MIVSGSATKKLRMKVKAKKGQNVNEILPNVIAQIRKSLDPLKKSGIIAESKDNLNKTESLISNGDNEGGGVQLSPKSSQGNKDENNINEESKMQQ